MSPSSGLLQNAMKVRKASKILARSGVGARNAVLSGLADLIRHHRDAILKANKKDVQKARRTAKASDAFLDRLMLDESRIDHMLDVIAEVMSAPDPIGKTLEEKVFENGLRARRLSAPLGVIFLIFESRPNVAVESFSLAAKSGNALILKGGRESVDTIEVLNHLMRRALSNAGLDPNAVWAVPSASRNTVAGLLQLHEYIDVVIPRGGASLIRFVSTHTQIPIIKNDRGMCHVYVDSRADLPMAVRIVDNAKAQRPGVCNSMETVLVHEGLSTAFFSQLAAFWGEKKQAMEYRACPKSYACFSKLALPKSQKLRRAGKNDWDTEHLDLILNCATVRNLDEALAHIEAHGSRHSEAIVTADAGAAERFLAEVDAAAVYWNASTRFTDGHEMGLGGEIGISTQKLHVRGPVGLGGLTCARWVLRGAGQVRG